MSQPFRPTVTRNGKKTKAKTWSIRYPNAAKKRVQENGFKTRDEAAIRLRDAKREVNEERAGIRTPRIKQNEKPLAEHLEDFQQSLENREISPDQVKLVVGRLKRAFNAIGFLLLSDLNVNDFQAHLASLRKEGRTQQTCKHIVRHAKQFTKFLLEVERIESDPFRTLRPPKVSERHHRRRALNPDESKKLLKATGACPTMFGLSGFDQKILILVAINTGFRASELSRMVVANLHLDGEYPHVSLSASNTKNRDEARIPLRDPEVVTILKSWIAGKPRNAKLWPGTWATSRGGSKIIQQALRAAEIPYEVDDRKADFHALRYTFITNLIKAGETPAYVQRLARHSDINLTFRVYADLGLEDLYHGTQQGNQNLRSQASGIQDDASREQGGKPSDKQPEKSGGSKSVARNVAHFSVSEGLLASSDVTVSDDEKGGDRPLQSQCDTSQMQKATGDISSCHSVSQKCKAERGGFEPPVVVTPRRFSRPVADHRNQHSGNALQNAPPVRCTECCTRCMGMQISPDLKALIEVWSELPEHIRKAILTLGQLPPKGGQ